jgi:hypothetical protein
MSIIKADGLVYFWFLWGKHNFRFIWSSNLNSWMLWKKKESISIWNAEQNVRYIWNIFSYCWIFQDKEEQAELSAVCHLGINFAATHLYLQYRNTVQNEAGLVHHICKIFSLQPEQRYSLTRSLALWSSKNTGVFFMSDVHFYLLFPFFLNLSTFSPRKSFSTSSILPQSEPLHFPSAFPFTFKDVLSQLQF